MMRRFSCLGLTDWDGITRLADTLFNGRRATEPKYEPVEPKPNPLVQVIVAGSIKVRHNGRIYRITATEIEVTR